jgi:hypothetical protein
VAAWRTLMSSKREQVHVDIVKHAAKALTPPGGCTLFSASATVRATFKTEEGALFTVIREIDTPQSVCKPSSSIA